MNSVKRRVKVFWNADGTICGVTVVGPKWWAGIVMPIYMATDYDHRPYPRKEQLVTARRRALSVVRIDTEEEQYVDAYGRTRTEVLRRFYTAHDMRMSVPV